MFARQLTKNSSAIARGFASSARAHKQVAVLGAAGGIGQPMSLLLKSNPAVTGLRLYDIRGAPGVAADISHVNTQSVVKGFEKDDIKEALTGAEIIIIPAGVPRKPGMTRDDLFNTNASIVRDLAEAVAEYAPKAFIGIISNPVNSTVPIFAEVLKKKGVFDEKRLFGITTLDVVRASRFLGEITNKDPKDVQVTVVGGHSGVTIVPLLSQTPAGKGVDGEAYKALVNRIQFGGDEVVKAKAGTGSATLSMGYAGARFTDSLIRALNGESGVVEPTFVKSPLYESEGVEYFASNVELGPEGVKKINSVGELSAEEQELLKAALPDLVKNIKKGVEFVKA
ncbi:malate dehydrogenase, NAD-dependent [Cryptococcus wingfieldii CBS 7118]|uniref:Malate dehydrogenase n=1 Tax=Cryptococcus wingfieldii CBS 7118 TaxID=1295528 RepID=A0A1E3K5N9_9TREE|nr:malate dehydrogenase, NAD-dependent [Cryptococcus wingfieldii CBS 7118]ODO08460.1 malate dehydrogenase, NAD-dependent [Cryptococcus wingfieldii CBS 7118]